MTVPVAELADPAASRAVLIGTHAYAHLEHLPAVLRNLQELSRLLCDPRHWGLPAGHCTVVDQPASASEVLDALSHAAAEARDTLLVYFAGHGLVDHLDDSFHLALPNTRPDRMYTALRFDDVRRVLRDPSTRAPRKVLIMDCCWSGRAMVGAMSGQDRAGQVAVAGTSVLTATAETRRAAAPPDEEFTAFTGELINIVNEGVEDAAELIDMESLYLALHRRLAARGRELPQQSNRNTAARICVLRNAAWPMPSAQVTGPTTTGSQRADVDELATGFSHVARVLARRYGPLGKNAANDDWLRGSAGRAAESILARLDTRLHPGARMAIRLLERVAEDAHDGTVTAILLADAMATRCRELIAHDTVDPLTLIRDLVRQTDVARAWLRSSAVPIEDRQIQGLVTAATGRRAASAVAEAIDRVGRGGTVTVTTGPGRSWQVVSEGSTAQIRVGAANEEAASRQIELLRKSVAIVHSAFEHGIVPGAGAGYLRMGNHLAEEGSPAHSVLSRTSTAPALHLARFVSGAPSLPELTEHALLGLSYDILHETYTSSDPEGQLFDPVHVMDAALAQATRAVISLLLPLPSGS
ncbi:caspase family protein [Embleya sp. NBC_00888]|uniref:caspase, EACC1-associated type n=1 Tax=Embleya sp. NBC_00888 TaxID=2975960 RepID=UPI00386338AE|nr:caspase family protein [Embleya sp. NBC_00888]